MTVGNLNGNWERLFKTSLVAMPMVLSSLLALNVWLVAEAFESRAFRMSSERFDKEDGRELELKVQNNQLNVLHLAETLGEIKLDIKDIKRELQGKRND